MSTDFICPSCHSEYEGAPCICEGGSGQVDENVRRYFDKIPRLRFLMDRIEKFILSDQTITCNAKTLNDVINDIREAQNILNS